MDKIKPDTNVLLNWKQKYTGPYVISCKLDGVSGLYTTEGEKAKLCASHVRLYTSFRENFICVPISFCV